ncbi:hypothetical protein RO575_18170 [Methylomonas sp. MO1]|uniref:hypothetical protein n=1 Tax=Methylomonas sp. MO1 TaxID=3073619 RepID=UPI0028A3EE65|nr:hypothetical protein [Methylomonas sp. MO1]MDT4291494.1 hypothetical protein [Methylomonas sp. MO1]
MTRFPYAPQLLEKAIKAAYFLCLFDKVVEHYQSLIPLQLPMVDRETQGFFENAEVVLSLGIPIDSLHMLSNILESIRLKHHFDIRTLDLSLIDTEETQELFSWIGTSSNVDATIEMNMELCEMLACQPNIDLGNMTVAFRACQN